MGTPLTSVTETFQGLPQHMPGADAVVDIEVVGDAAVNGLCDRYDAIGPSAAHLTVHDRAAPTTPVEAITVQPEIVPRFDGLIEEVQRTAGRRYRRGLFKDWWPVSTAMTAGIMATLFSPEAWPMILVWPAFGLFLMGVIRSEIGKGFLPRAKAVKTSLTYKVDRRAWDGEHPRYFLECADRASQTFSPQNVATWRNAVLTLARLIAIPNYDETLGVNHSYGQFKPQIPTLEEFDSLLNHSRHAAHAASEQVFDLPQSMGLKTVREFFKLASDYPEGVLVLAVLAKYSAMANSPDLVRDIPIDWVRPPATWADLPKEQKDTLEKATLWMAYHGNIHVVQWVATWARMGDKWATDLLAQLEVWSAQHPEIDTVVSAVKTARLLI